MDMKPSLALSHLLMLSTSLLCVAPLAAKQQSDTLSEGSIANAMGVEKSTFSSNEREGVIFDNATVDAQQSSAKKSQGMTSRPGYQSKADNKGCTKADRPYRFDVKHIEAKGLGYNQGYTSIDGFFTGKEGGWIPFLDLRAHVFNNGKWAANAGIGTRYVINPCKSMVGINAYYDYRHTKHGSYNQVGAGLEGYYDHFEVRVNGYLPVGEKRHVITSTTNSLEFKEFEGHYAHYTKNLDQKVEGAMKGFTSEVGSHIAGDMKNYDLYFGIGPYYFDVGSGDHMWGGKARLKAEVTKYLFLEISDSYDHVFHNRFQGTVTLSIPFGGKKCYRNGPCQSRNKEMVDNIMDWRGVLPVERQEIIVVEKFKKKKAIDPIAYDPVTGVPIYFVFVNNTNTAASPDGSFENPAQNLSNGDGLPSAQSLASTNNVIYVFPGDGTATHMKAGMALNFNGMRLLGSGISNSFNTTDGVLVIPPQSAAFPRIEGQPNSTNAVLFAANGVEISGFYIGPNDNNAVGTSNTAGIRTNTSFTDVTITNNVIYNGMHGIALNDTAGSASGNIIITNNLCSMQSSPNGTAGNGILLGNIGNSNTVVNNNSITLGLTTGANAPTNGVQIVCANNNALQFLNNEVLSVTSTGFFFNTSLTAPTVNMTAIISNNLITHAGTIGMEFVGNSAGSSKLIVTNNTVLNTGTSDDFVFDSINIANTNIFCLRFNNNTWTQNVHFAGMGSIAQVEPVYNPNGGSFIFPIPSLITPVKPCFCDVIGCP
jgi:hypothetical protein